MKGLSLLIGAALVVSGCASRNGPVEDLKGDVVIAWNERVLAIAEAEDGFLTLKGLRTATMMHLAMHDALNATDARYQSYLPSQPVVDAHPLAAAAQAAYEIAIDQYPGEGVQFEAELGRWMAVVEEGAARTKGVEVGSAAAGRVLAERQSDGWDSEAEYQFHPMGPGVYAEFEEHSGTPEGFVFGAGWAAARPFLLESSRQFLAPPPPGIDSKAYTEAYAEVKDVGCFESASRTPDQAHLAMWWKEFVEKSHNRLARQLVSEEETDLWDAARMFALLNMSIYDGYVNVFDNKFLYNHWRPYTAIRWADNDGNPQTEPDPEWNNLHRHTYAFPSYPSAHGTVCAAAMTIFASTLGDDSQFSMTTPEVDEAGPLSAKIDIEPPTRSFDSFSSAAMECALSRVYLGIHFRYDSVAGNELGTKIGKYAAQNALRPNSS